MGLLSYIWRGLVLGGVAAIQPGPFQAYLLGQVLRQGWRRTAVAALAPLFSDIPVIFLTLLVLTQLPNGLLDGLRVAGSGYLFYLAWQAINHPPQPTKPDETESSQSLMKAVLVNLLNPNPYIFWSTLGATTILEGWAISAWHGLSFLLGFYGAIVTGLFCVIFLFGKMGAFSARTTYWLNLISGVALVGFGLFQLWTVFI